MRSFRGLLWAMSLWCLAAWVPAMAIELQFDSAMVTSEVEGRVNRDLATLPFRWDMQYPGRVGRATLEMEFVSQQMSAGPLGIYLPKIGSAYSVALNGTVIGLDGDMEVGGGADTGKIGRAHV